VQRPCHAALLIPLALVTLAGCGARASGPAAPSSLEQPTGVQLDEIVGPTESGTFAPVGPPLGPPTRVDAGGHCIIDLHQGYQVAGGLTGSFEIDYRIITYGPCPVGPPVPGAYAEDWIAHGTFAGTVHGAPASASLSYTGHAKAGGEVQGRIVLSDGLEGQLRVLGDFDDGELAYRGPVQ
jgi:hypothetical protein